MKKEDLFNALIVSEYVAFILATILVVVFQFIGMGLIITLALAFYVVAFTLCMLENVFLCLGLFDIKNKDVEASIPNLAIVGEDGEKITVKDAKKNIKNRKIKAIIMAVISGLIAVFTLVVLIMF